MGFATQVTPDATRFKQRGTKPLGELPKRLATLDGARLGHAIEIVRWNQFGVQGEGDGLGQLKLLNLLAHITGDKLNRRSHFRHDALGLFDPL